MRNELLVKCEQAPEALNTVINMLDKNREEATQYGTDAEVQIITNAMVDLMNDAGYYGKDVWTAIQYLTGRLTAEDLGA